MSDNEIDLDGFKKFLNSHKEPHYPIDDHKYGAMSGHLKKLFGGDEYRKKFMAWAFGADTSEARKALSQARRGALWTWLSPEFEELMQTWLIREQCQRTASALIAMWQVEAGQQALFAEMDKPLTDTGQEIIDTYYARSK